MTDAGPAEQAAPTPYYVVFDVDVRDAPRYGMYMALVLPRSKQRAASTWRAAGRTVTAAVVRDRGVVYAGQAGRIKVRLPRS
jgi:hypothetical protein